MEDKITSQGRGDQINEVASQGDCYTDPVTSQGGSGQQRLVAS